MKYFSVRLISAVFAAGLFFVLPLFFSRAFDEQFLEPKRLLMELLIVATIFLALVTKKWKVIFYPRWLRGAIFSALALCAVVLLSCLQSSARAYSAVEALAFLCGPLWMLLLMWGKFTERQLVWMFRAVLFASTIVALIVLLQWGGHDPLLLGGAKIEWNTMVPRMRLYSTLGNPNLVASYLVGSAFLPLALIGESGSRIWAVLAVGAAQIAILIAMVGCGSRGAWFGLAAGFTVALLLQLSCQWNKRSPFRVLGALAALAFISVSAIAVFPEIMPVTMQRLGGRVYMWRVALPLFTKHPMFGSGWGSLSLRFLDLQAAFIAQNPGMANHWSNPAQLHNDPLQFLVETGIVGVVAVLILLVLYVARARTILSRSSSLRINLTNASAGGISAILAGSIFNFQMANPPVLILFFTYLAVPFLSSRNRIEDVAEPANAEKPSRFFSAILIGAKFAALILAAFALWRIAGTARADLKYAAAMRVEEANPSDAARLYGEAAQLAPWNGLMHFGFARELYVQDRDAEALTEAQLATKTYSDSHLEVLMARILQDMHREVEAQDHYRRARDLDPALPPDL